MLEERGLRCRRRTAREQQDGGKVGGLGKRPLGSALGVDPVRAGGDRRLDPCDQLLERRVREAVVERGIAHAGPGGSEEDGRDHWAVGLDQGQVLGARVLDAVGDGARAPEALVGEAVVGVADGDAVAEGVRGHLEDHGEVHGGPPARRVRRSVGGGERLGLCDFHRLRVAAQLTLAGLGDEHGGLADRARVALTHQICHVDSPVTLRAAPSAPRSTTPRHRCL